MNKLKHKKRTIILSILIVSLAGLFVCPKIVKALFDEGTAVHVDASSIENSTLIIGTHLIYLYSLNDELYGIAKESASASGQDRVYYKSELADGAWFDITDAGSIKDITTSGSKVSDQVVNELFFTYHTKSDGITYDLKNNQKVSVFDIKEPYDLNNMDELEAIKLQADRLTESGANTDTQKRNLKYMQDFFAADVKKEETDVCDGQLSKLQSYYEYLSANGEDAAQKEVIVSVMAKVDNTRRALVFQDLDEKLANLQEQIAASTSNDENIEYYESDDSLLTAIGDSQSKLMESMTEAEGNRLDAGTTNISNKEYELENELIQSVLSNDYASCEAVVKKLIALSHISNDLIVSAKDEEAVLDELIQVAEEKYRNELAAGVSEEYKAEKEKNSSAAIMNNIMREDIAKVDSARNELQFFIKAKTDRMDEKQVPAYMEDVISKADSFMKSIKPDDYKSFMQESVENYKKWLLELLSGKTDSDNSKDSSLYEKKEELQEKYLEALDKQNLDQAKLLEAQLASVEEEITKKENVVTDLLNNLQKQKEELQEQIKADPSNTALQTVLAGVENQIAEESKKVSDNGIAGQVMALKKDAVSLLDGKNTDSQSIDSLKTVVEGLGSILESGSSFALTSLKDIYQQMVSSAYLNDISEYDDIISEIEDMVAKSDVLEKQQKGVTSEAAVKAIEDTLGVEIKGTDQSSSQSISVENLSEEEVLAVLLALGDYAQQSGNDEIQNLASGMAANLGKEKNIPVFKTFKDSGDTYAPADLLAEFTGYRYLWNNSKKSIVLSKGKSYYSFSAFYSKVIREKEQVDWLDTAAAFSGTVYIPNSYISTNFECEIYDISGTEYSVLANDKIMELAKNLFGAISEKGGG